ncbi:MAG: hypothetical protein BWY75_01521 [bacterium ADurb.Bin425]|nr:MAG: hypothetical protein BWY75_01521 [bacterium ADurb.Bin425]
MYSPRRISYHSVPARCPPSERVNNFETVFLLGLVKMPSSFYRFHTFKGIPKGGKRVPPFQKRP